jgi:hypothetical protein
LKLLMKNLPKLQKLDVSNTSLNDDSLFAMAHRTSKSISRLNIASCKGVTMGGIKALGKCSALAELNLNRTCVSGAIGKLFSGSAWNHIESLNLNNCPKLSELTLVTTRMSKLTSLTLSSNANLATCVLQVPLLTTLVVSNCKVLRSMAVTAPRLQTLDVSMCTRLVEFRVNDKADSKSATKSSAIHTINMFQCRSLSPASVRSVTKAVQHSVRSWNMGGMIQLADHQLQNVMLQCEQLQALVVNGCKQLGPDVLQHARVSYAPTANRIEDDDT